MKLSPTRANSVRVGNYKFRLGEWTDVADKDLDYLLCRWCPYVLVENEFSGPYWVRNVDQQRPFRYFVNGDERTIRIPVGSSVPLDRHIAYQLLKHDHAEVPPLSDIVSPGDKVLVLRYGGLGDVLLTTPAVEQAAQELGVVIDYSTSDYLTRLVEDNPSVHAVYGYHGFDPAEYQAVVDLRRLSEAAEDCAETHRADIFARAFGVQLSSYQMRYSVRADERAEIDELVPESCIVVQATASVPRRTLPEPKTIELLKRLVELGHTPVVVDDRVGSSFSVEGACNLTGKLTIPQLFAVVERADVVVAADSGVMHAALAVGTKTVGLFGSVAAKLRVKNCDHCRTLEASQFGRGCAPCTDRNLPRCNHPGTCLDVIPVDAIIEEVVALGGH